MEMEQEKAACVQKVKKLGTEKASPKIPNGAQKTR